jgi:purine catabolism regulator
MHRPVRWVHISELADIAGMLHGGELVLTTGVMLPADREPLARYIDDLADVGAAGLVVELGRRYADELPRALVKAAQRRGLPLIALRTEVRFVAVTEAVHAHVIDAQLTELRASEAVHQTFNELSVEGAEPAEVVREVARMTRAPVVLENLSHQVLAFDAAGQDPQELLDGWERRSREVRPSARTGYDPRNGWLVTAVGARGRDWGRLVLVGAPDEEPAPRLAVVLERGASTLALDRLLERDRESLERQTHRTLLSGILTHALTVSDVALRARALGVPLEGRRLVGVMLRLLDGAASRRLSVAGGRGTSHSVHGYGEGRRAEGPASAALEAQARLRDFTETAALAVRERGLSALIGGLDDDGVGLLISLSPSDDEHTALERFASTLGRLAGAPGTDPAFLMAAGSSVGSLRDARRTLLEAAQVADAADRTTARDAQGRREAPPAEGDRRRRVSSYYRLPDVRLRGLLHLLRDDARLQTYVERELGLLLSHDAKNGTDLVRILSIYLASGRNKSAAADAAHMSRPSFYDRLHKVERILDADLDQVESCLSLHVALLALEAVRR